MIARSTYVGQLRVESIHLNSDVRLITDAPLDNNGKGQSFSPTDCVATSLATCILTIIGIASQHKGIDIKGSTAGITKVMASSPRRIAKIAVDIEMRGECTDEHKKELERAGRACPVAKSLHPDIEQDISFTWVS